jgi:putative two-component system response regulator
MTEKVTILAVDDEPANTRLLEALLVPMGYEVIVARNGNVALTMVLTEKIDLALIDLLMPGLNGFEVCRQIKEHSQLNIPVILLTAMTDTTNKVIGLNCGADDFLAKPFEKEELFARIKAHLRIKHMVDEIRSLNLTLENKVKQRTAIIKEKNEKIAESCHLTLDALIHALDAREHETGKHSLRVSFYTVELARAWKAWEISGQELAQIAMGALCHDLGKIGVSDSILLKPGKLTDEEWAQMKKHPQTGWDIVKNIEFLGLGRKLVLSHHERFDGQGYPQGLKGDHIYIGARFFSLADTLDAMTNDRPYRKALTFEDFENELKRCSATQFDPQVVETFFSIPRDRWFQLMERTNGVDCESLMDVVQIEDLW